MRLREGAEFAKEVAFQLEAGVHLAPLTAPQHLLRGSRIQFLKCSLLDSILEPIPCLRANAPEPRGHSSERSNSSL